MVRLVSIEQSQITIYLVIPQIHTGLPHTVQVGELLHNPAQLLGLWPHRGDRWLLEYLTASLAAGVLCQLQWEPAVECWSNGRWEDCACLPGEATGNGGVVEGVCMCICMCVHVCTCVGVGCMCVCGWVGVCAMCIRVGVWVWRAVSVCMCEGGNGRRIMCT